MPRSIKDSVGDAAFEFVRHGFDEPSKKAVESPPVKSTNEESNGKRSQQVLREVSRPSPKSRTKSPPKKATVEARDHLASFSTRTRASLIADLKREGLRRQLSECEPHTLQDILATAAQEWLNRHRTPE